MLDSLDLGTIDIMSPVGGGALNLPQGLWEPGSLSAYKGHFGTGATLTPFAGALVVGPSATSPISIFATGVNTLNGTTTQTGSHTTVGQHMVTGTELRTFVVNNDLDGVSNNLIAAATNTLTAATSNKLVSPVNIISGTVTKINGLLNLTGVGDVATAINSKKGFDIKHPNKDGWRLRHICVEGPESAIYIRGRISGENFIKLPDYWKGLVDYATITVHLNQIGTSQDLIIDKITNEGVYIKSGNASHINCYYHIWADRLGDKLTPEYEGSTPLDYPGDNTQYSLAGWDYDKR